MTSLEQSDACLLCTSSWLVVGGDSHCCTCKHALHTDHVIMGLDECLGDKVTFFVRQVILLVIVVFLYEVYHSHNGLASGLTKLNAMKSLLTNFLLLSSTLCKESRWLCNRAMLLHCWDLWASG